MEIRDRTDAIGALETAEQELALMVHNSEVEMAAVGSDFEDLARQSDTVLNVAAAITGFVEDDNVLAVLPKVQSLGEAAKLFIQGRLQATEGILEAVAAEAVLLGRLSQLTRGQKAIARETRNLSVLTSIEVARIGQLGAGFQYLANELSDFSQTVTRSTRDLGAQTDERKTALEETRRTLAIELPRMRQELGRTEAGLEDEMAAVNSSLAELARAPSQFRDCVQQIAGQIAGVVAAVQAYDITRQQVEHVGQTLAVIASSMRAVESGQKDARGEQPRILVGLAIQIYQLRSIQATVGAWLSQIRRCIDGILQISSSQLVEIGPVVLGHERQLARQLARIEALEQKSQVGNQEIERTLAVLANLMQLVGEHVEKSRSVRDRLQLLTFNSIVEASRLGARADAILEISRGIKRISAAWSGITDQSAGAMEEILAMVKQARQGMSAFSQSGTDRLREAHNETSAGLAGLRTAAAAVAGRAVEIEAGTGKLQARVAAVGVTADRLDNCFARIAAVLKQIEELKCGLESEWPDAAGRWNQTEAEELFSSCYTTETERQVLRAALAGAPLPGVEQNLVGNDAELF
ncbi:MAG: hypothetical protein ABR956_15225 [Terracidiphilus sp.]|jgi:hypothetical protein